VATKDVCKPRRAHDNAFVADGSGADDNPEAVRDGDFPPPRRLTVATTTPATTMMAPPISQRRRRLRLASSNSAWASASVGRSAMDCVTVIVASSTPHYL
jgi:hypothetical protein